MTGLVGRATIICVCGLFVAGTALASVPSPAHCHFSGQVIKLVGRNSSNVPDTYGTYTVQMRDGSTSPNPDGQPIVNAAVRFDFGACSDIAICSETVSGTGGTVDCNVGNKSIFGTTDINGNCTIIVLGVRRAARPPGGGSATGSAPGDVAGGNGCVVVTDVGSGTVISTSAAQGLGGFSGINASTIDSDSQAMVGGTAGLNGGDITVVGNEVLCVGLGATPKARCDILTTSGNLGVVNSGDISEVGRLVVRVPQLSTNGCTTVCPN